MHVQDSQGQLTSQPSCSLQYKVNCQLRRRTGPSLLECQGSLMVTFELVVRDESALHPVGTMREMSTCRQVNGHAKHPRIWGERAIPKIS